MSLCETTVDDCRGRSGTDPSSLYEMQRSFQEWSQRRIAVGVGLAGDRRKVLVVGNSVS